jgi:hypothetical protein
VAHNRFYASVAAVAFSLVMAAGPTRAAVFADFTPDTAVSDFKWIRAGGAGEEGTFLSVSNPASNAPQNTAVHFSFLDPALSALAFLPANFMLNSGVTTPTPATLNVDGSFSQTNIDGSFSFIYTGPNQTIGSVHLVQNVTNLLSGVFSAAYIKGLGNSGSANLASTLGTLSYTSDVETFANLAPGTEEFAFNMLADRSAFTAILGKALSGFTANGGGNFSFATIPEPSSWLLMVAGFGGLGAALRARRRNALAA